MIYIDLCCRTYDKNEHDRHHERVASVNHRSPTKNNAMRCILAWDMINIDAKKSFLKDGGAFKQSLGVLRQVTKHGVSDTTKSVSG